MFVIHLTVQLRSARRVLSSPNSPKILMEESQETTMSNKRYCKYFCFSYNFFSKHRTVKILRYHLQGRYCSDVCVIRDFLQSPHSIMNCLQHARSSGPGAIVRKPHATHQALITCNMSCCVPLGMKGQLNY